MTQKRITLRMPERLYNKLVDSIELSGRTLTGEILERLNASYEKESDLEKKIRTMIKEELGKK